MRVYAPMFRIPTMKMKEHTHKFICTEWMIQHQHQHSDGPDLNRWSPNSPQTSSRRPPKPQPRKTTIPRAVSIEDSTYHGYSESIHKHYGSIGSSTLPKNFRQRDQKHTKPEQPFSVGPITRQGSDQPITDQF